MKKAPCSSSLSVVDSSPRATIDRFGLSALVLNVMNTLTASLESTIASACVRITPAAKQDSLAENGKPARS
jgi:hypothetical protein